MLLAGDFSMLPAAADSARVVEHVYAVSLSALAPIGIAGVATIALRRSQAASRAAILRAGVVALAIVFLGGLLPFHRIAWIVPSGLADPLIALGRMQMGAPLARLIADQPSGADVLLVRWLLAVYVVGALAVLVPFTVACARLASRTHRATVVSNARIQRVFDDARLASGVSRRVPLLSSGEVG